MSWRREKHIDSHSHYSVEYWCSSLQRARPDEKLEPWPDWVKLRVSSVRVQVESCLFSETKRVTAEGLDFNLFSEYVSCSPDRGGGGCSVLGQLCPAWLTTWKRWLQNWHDPSQPWPRPKPPSPVSFPRLPPCSRPSNSNPSNHTS